MLIYNPQAGRFGGNGGRLVERIAGILTKNGHQVTAAPTTGPGTGGAIARQHIAGGADLVVAAGGDGTVNEVAEGVVHSDVPLAILPAGTANVLGAEMKLGTRIERVAERLEEFRPRRISVGHLTCDGGRVSRHFLSMAGIGLDAYVVRQVDGALKARTGKLAYWVAGWSLLGHRLAQLQVETCGVMRECSFALVSKVRNYGGDFEIAREVTLLDDQFEVVLFEGRTTVPYVKYFAGLVLDRLRGMKGVTMLRTGCLTLAGPADGCAYVQVDGELAGCLPAEVRVVPDALTLLVPQGYGTRKDLT